ncbi:hypothetical protein BS78_05G265400 [Paspalum vaginatum]|nr:hypothetical protein BS78_05G265400 [Paspalum vaginatum]
MDLPGLDPSPGLEFERRIWDTFGLPVTVSDSPGFLLVVSFGRCKFKLTEISVGRLLQATIGGSADLFQVATLGQRVFKFTVSASSVGFAIYRLRGFTCAAWVREAADFHQEEEASWHKVQGKRRSGPSYAEVVSRRPALQKQSVFDRIQFVAERNHNSPLTGANLEQINVAEPVHQHQVRRQHGIENSNFSQVKSVNCAQKSTTVLGFKSLNWAPKFTNCLSPVHTALNCSNRARCSSCLGWGHLNSDCPTRSFSNSREPILSLSLSDNFLERKFRNLDGSWLTVPRKLNCGPNSTLIPRFASFSEYHQAFFGNKSSAEEIDARSWFNVTSPMTGGSPPNEPPVCSSFTALRGFLLASSTGDAPSTSSPNPSAAFNLNLQLQTPITNPAPLATMAFERADPTPFLPRGMLWQAVENRTPAVRSILRRPQPRHENIAIVTVDPLPGNPMHFHAVHDVLREFLVDFRRLEVIDIQPTHLGQAYVRFRFQHDCENLILSSPHAFGDVNVSFAKHNRGRNWKSVQFNRDCWLMLMGFPLDYWEQDYLDQAFSPFGHVLKWENDRSRLARLIVKARVIDLESAPQFLIISDADAFQGESWTVQCEIIQNNLLGGLPPDEDPMPDLPLDPHAPFNYYGLGQPGNGPMFAQQGQQGLQGEHMAAHGGNANQDAVNNDQQENPEWDPWPEELPAQPNVVPDLNQNPVEEIEEVINMAEEEELPDLNAPHQPFQVIVEDWMAEDEEDPEEPLEVAAGEQELPPHQEAPLQPAMQLPNAPQGSPLRLINEEISGQLMDHYSSSDDQQQTDIAVSSNARASRATQPDSPDSDQHNHILHIGRMEFASPQSADPGWMAYQDNGPFFQPTTVEIPAVWAAFFTMMLLSPSHYSWAKEFVSSSAMDFFREIGPSIPIHLPMPFQLPTQKMGIADLEDSLTLKEVVDIPQSLPMSFQLPTQKMGTADLGQSLTLEEVDDIPQSNKDATAPHHVDPSSSGLSGSSNQQQMHESVTTPNLLKDKMMITGGNMRRSDRIREQSKGFKNHGCSQKNCTMCDSTPPTIPSSLIRNLGEKFCKIDPKLLTDDLLQATNKGPGSIGPKKSKKQKKQKGDAQHDHQNEPKKKPKK